MMDDARLNECARAHQAGELEALRPLVEALTRSLVAMGYRYVGNWESARDLTQETWLRVHRSIRQWDPSRPVRPWVFTIHRNLCLDHLRSCDGLVRDDLVLADMESPGADPFTALARSEFVARVRSALGGLSEVQRRVLVMVDLEELKPAEVAATTGMKPATVRTTLHFARRKLAGLLGKEDL